ncbi:MAG: TRAP transporter TatT component family protein [Limisphaerales bacterium]
MTRTLVASLMAAAVALCGCSFKRLAANKIGDALAGSGGTFASDDDPDLVRAAVPFSLKLIESLLAETPRHEGLLLAAASGFTQFSYAFVQQDSEEAEDKDLAAAEALRGRARRLYLRARDYGLRGLEVRHRGFGAALRAAPKQTVRLATVKDVPLLYWTGAAWAAAISDSKDNPDLIADLPVVEAMMERALELDERFGDGALHCFFIAYEMGRPATTGDAAERARRHFDRAIALSGGCQAAPWVDLAEQVCVQKQDLNGFRAALEKALAVDADAKPEWRLENLVMQRRAKWLLGRADQLFLKADNPPQ